MIEPMYQRIRRSTLFILYYPLGSELGTYHQATDCANAIIVHPTPERLMVRGLDDGREAFRMPAVEFGMTIYD